MEKLKFGDESDEEVEIVQREEHVFLLQQNRRKLNTSNINFEEGNAQGTTRKDNSSMHLLG